MSKTFLYESPLSVKGRYEYTGLKMCPKGYPNDKLNGTCEADDAEGLTT